MKMSGHTHTSRNLQNSTLLTQGLASAGDSRHAGHLELTTVHICIAVWVFLSNSSQLLNILLTPTLRRRSRNILVVNVCLVEMVIGVFLCPLYSDSLLEGQWRHSPLVCTMYEAVFYIQACVSTLSILILLVERFYYLLTPRSFRVKGKHALIALLVTLPWFLGIGLVSPLVIYGSAASINKETGSCQIIWRTKFQTTAVFVSFFCPAFLTLVVAVLSVVIYSLVSVLTKRPRDELESDRQEMRDSLCVILLASVTSVAFQFPFFLVMLMEIFCQGDCGRHRPDSTWVSVMLVNMLKPGATPLVWLAFTDIRRGFANLCQRSSSSYASAEVTYPGPRAVRTFSEDEPVVISSRTTML